MMKKWLPHAAILLSNMYIVFFVLDKVNSAMTFINNNITKGLLLILALISIANACFMIGDQRRAIRAARKKMLAGKNARQAAQKAKTVSQPASKAKPAPRQALPVVKKP